MVDLESRRSFSFFISYWEAIEELPEKEQLPVLKAIIKYAFFDEEPTNFKGVKRAVFLLVKPTLDKSKQKSASGKRGGSKPKANGKQTQSDISEGKGVGKGEGLGIGEGEGEDSTRSDGSWFTTFWNAYPEQARHRRDEAWEAWKKLNPDPRRSVEILQNLEAWKESDRWLEPQFIPLPVNFLDADRGYLNNKPAPARKPIPKGASGQLGAAEEEAIRRVLEEPIPDIPFDVDGGGDW